MYRFYYTGSTKTRLGMYLFSAMWSVNIKNTNNLFWELEIPLLILGRCRGWCIKFATHKWPLQLTKVHFMTISSRFFANYFDIFHKTEVQTVILRWWTGLNLNWLKSYDTNRKYFHFNPSRKFDAPPYTYFFTNIHTLIFFVCGWTKLSDPLNSPQITWIATSASY